MALDDISRSIQTSLTQAQSINQRSRVASILQRQQAIASQQELLIGNYPIPSIKIPTPNYLYEFPSTKPADPKVDQEKLASLTSGPSTKSELNTRTGAVQTPPPATLPAEQVAPAPAAATEETPVPAPVPAPAPPPVEPPAPVPPPAEPAPEVTTPAE
jgi:hypothetical protein